MTVNIKHYIYFNIACFSQKAFTPPSQIDDPANDAGCPRGRELSLNVKRAERIVGMGLWGGRYSCHSATSTRGIILSCKDSSALKQLYDIMQITGLHESQFLHS